MALIKCPECGYLLLDNLNICKNCNYILKKWQSDLVNIILKSYVQYQNLYCKNIILPDINIINFSTVNSNVLASVEINPLYYNKIVNLNVSIDNTILLKYNTAFVLFHEYTHIKDSIKFCNQSKDDFNIIMTTYSEFHASQIEMDLILNSIKILPITIHSKVSTANEISLQKFMNEAYNNLLDCYNNGIKSAIDFDYKFIYYFFGYLKSLKIHHIEYIIDQVRIDFNNLVKQMSYEYVKNKKSNN